MFNRKRFQKLEERITLLEENSKITLGKKPYTTPLQYVLWIPDQVTLKDVILKLTEYLGLEIKKTPAQSEDVLLVKTSKIKKDKK